MDAFVVGTALVGSFIGAFAIQKAALEGLLRLMDEGRRHSPMAAAYARAHSRPVN